MTLRPVSLDDKYDLNLSHVFVTGYQALIRACLMQKERDRQAGLEHRRLSHRLSRFPARRPRPAVHPRRPRTRRRRHQVPTRPQRGTRRHRALGHPAGRTARRGQVRWRVRPLVRQGPRRRPLRRRVPPRQSVRHLEERRRHRADGRRPHRGILHHRAPVRIPFRRRDDADPQPGRRAGDHRLRALWLGDVALHRHLDRAQMHA